MSKLGIHFPNGGFRDMDRLWSINWGAFTVLHDQRSRIPEIRAHYRDAKILVRAYLPDWWAKDARQWAEEIADWFNRDCAPWGCDLTPYNEMNLSVESSHPNAVDHPPVKLYEDIRDKCEANFARLFELIPTLRSGQTRLHFPALAPGHNDVIDDGLGYIGIEKCRGVIEKYCKVIGVHAYWDDASNRESPFLGRRYEKYHALFPTFPLFIKEAGAHLSRDRDDAEDYRLHLNGLPEYVQAECFYIWDGNENQEGWRLGNKANMVQMFQNYVPQPVPPAPSRYLRDSQVFQLCFAAGFPEPITPCSIIFAENGKNDTLAVYGNTDGSRDRGLCQENDKAHPEISDACAFDPVCAVREMKRISDEWGNFNAWTTFKLKLHEAQMPRARVAAQTALASFLQSAYDRRPTSISLPMPVNTNAGIYKSAQLRRKNCPETPEWEFDFAGKTRVMQEYTHDLGFIEKGNALAVQWIDKLAPFK